VSLLAAVAEDRPVLVVVDDLHWLDRASASALSFAARRLHGAPVALLLATRARDDGAIAEAAPVPHLRLRGLPPDAAAAVLDRRLPSGVPPHVRRRLLALAGGNPLALRELSAALSPAQLAGRAMLPDPVPVTSIIEDAFLQRTSGVSSSAHTLLLVAAAERLGDVGLVLRAGRTLGCDASALAEAEDAGLLVVVRATRCRPLPIRAARRSLRNTSAKTVTATPRAATPVAAATSSVLVESPMTARIASATTGRPSLTKLFQMPVSTVARRISAPE
jgi:hypothetical protein